MKLKIVHEFLPNEVNNAKRLIHSDDAFELLWNIVHEHIRPYFKYSDNPNIKDAENVLENIRKDIANSGLLELYN